MRAWLRGAASVVTDPTLDLMGFRSRRGCAMNRRPSIGTAC